MSLEMWPVPAEWHHEIESFLAAQRASGSPDTTIYTRRQHLSHLARGLKIPPWQVPPDELVEWFAANTWARETRRGRRTTFRGFWDWAVATGRTNTNTALALPVVKAAQPSPRPVPEVVLSNSIHATDLRTALILTLAAEVGMRRAEIAQAQTDDLFPDLDGWSLIVHGKGGRERTVPLSEQLANELRALPEGWFFPGRINGHLSARHVGKLASRALTGDWTLHAGRHRYATLAYRASGDLLVVQDLLGHASPVTTRAYIAPDRGRARAIIESLPRAA